MPFTLTDVISNSLLGGHMKSIQILYFLDLAKTLNFTETANRFYISQPAVSKQIIALEQELNTKLFERNRKSVALTRAGMLYFDFFSQSKEAFDALQQEVARFSENKNKTLTISFLMAWNLSAIFPKLVKTYKESFPHINLVLENHTFNTLDDCLNRGDIDLAITLTQKDRLKMEYITQDITTIKSLLFYSKDHPLGGKTALTVEDFKDEDFIIYTDQTEQYSRNLIKSILAPYGFVPKTIVVSSIEAMILAVEAGQGVAFFDEWIRYKSNPNLNYMTTQMTRDVKAIWLKKNDSKAIRNFVKTFEAIVDDIKA